MLSAEQFASRQWDGILAQYLVVDLVSNEMAGAVALYNYNPRGQNVYLAAYGHPRNRGLSIVTEGALLMVEYAFTTWNLRKLYIECLEFNMAQFRSAARYMTEEGRLVDHEWAQGCWWDQLTLSVSREAWKEARKKLLPSVAAAASE